MLRHCVPHFLLNFFSKCWFAESNSELLPWHQSEEMKILIYKNTFPRFGIKFKFKFKIFIIQINFYKHFWTFELLNFYKHSPRTIGLHSHTCAPEPRRRWFYSANILLLTSPLLKLEHCLVLPQLSEVGRIPDCIIGQRIYYTVHFDLLKTFWLELARNL